MQANDRLQQNRFSGARSANNAQNVPAPYIQIKVMMNHKAAKLIVQAAHLDHTVIGVVLGLFGLILYDHILNHHHPIVVKNIAKNASSTITRKIDSTTAAVVFRPKDSAVPCTDSP